jgi:hypothetical protein
MRLTFGRPWWIALSGAFIAIAGLTFWSWISSTPPPARISPQSLVPPAPPLPISEFSLPSLPIIRSFPALGIKKVILRAAAAQSSEIIADPVIKAVEVSGVPTGGAQGYHSPDPSWRETPAAQWGLDFVSTRYGELMVISTLNEISYLHHFYSLESVALRFPNGIEVVREPRKLTGDGAPNLEEPPR